MACVTEPEKSQPWEVRKQHTLDSISELPLEAILILCADKLHKLKSIRKDIEKQGESVWQKVSRPKETRMSKMDIVFDILTIAGQPLHIQDILAAIEKRFGKKFDRESLVAALAAAVMLDGF